MNGFHLLGLFVLIFAGCFGAAWYWLRYGFNEMLAVAVALAVMGGLFVGGLALIDARKPVQTITRGLT